MNWYTNDGAKKDDNEQTLSVVKKTSSKSKKLNVQSSKPLLIILPIVLVILILLYSGAPLVKCVERMSIWVDGHPWDPLSHKIESKQDIYNSIKWLAFGVAISVLVLTSYLMLVIRYKRRANFVDYVGGAFSILSVSVWLAAWILKEGGNDETAREGIFLGNMSVNYYMCISYWIIMALLVGYAGYYWFIVRQRR